MGKFNALDKMGRSAWLGLMALFLGVSAQAGYSSPGLKVTLQEQELIFHVEGQADLGTVFILGGGPGFTSWNLEPIQKQVADQGYQAVVMDMQGIGENVRPFQKPILETWAAQIEAVRQALNAQPVTLIGHSWGALMAMLYIERHPQQVDKLILLNPVDPEKKAMAHLTTEIHQRNLDQQNPQWDNEQAWGNEIGDSQAQLERITLRQIQQVLPTYFYDYSQGVAYANQFSSRDFNIDLNVSAWKEYDRHPLNYELFEKWRKPVYFMECRQDHLMPYNLQAMQAQIDFRRVDLLESCGHFPWVEKPHAFKALIKAYLNGPIH